MKKSNLFFICFILAFSSACLKKDKGATSSGTSTTGSGQTGGGGGGGGGGETTATFGRIFMTSTEVNGGYGGSDTTSGGAIAEKVFDQLCASEATAKNLTGTYRALISTTRSRWACTSANCATSGTSENSHWVLKPNTEYRRVDGVTVIGTTKEKGIFSFPLTNSIVDTTTPTYVWTGFKSDWRKEPSVDNCTDFTVAGSTGIVGDVSRVDSGAIASPDTWEGQCNTNKQVLCVEIIAKVTTLTAQPAYRKIMVTSNTITGGDGGTTNGVTRFDNFCQAQANTLGIGHSGKTIYKAIIYKNELNGANNRYPCLTAYCGNGDGEATNWVLEASREYRRTDGTTVIASTTANRIFSFPLTNSFSSTNSQIYTGVTDSWARSSVDNQNNCGWFAYGDSAYESYYGSTGDVGAGALNTGSITCDNALKIACAEQTRSQDVFTEYPGYDLGY